MTPKNSVEALKESEILSCAKVFSAQEWGFSQGIGCHSLIIKLL